MVYTIIVMIFFDTKCQKCHVLALALALAVMKTQLTIIALVMFPCVTTVMIII